MSTDNEELQQYLTPSALKEDSDTDLLDKDELDIQYSNEFDIPSKPSSITTWTKIQETLPIHEREQPTQGIL